MWHITDSPGEPSCTPFVLTDVDGGRQRGVIAIVWEKLRHSDAIAAAEKQSNASLCAALSAVRHFSLCSSMSVCALMRTCPQMDVSKEWYICRAFSLLSPFAIFDALESAVRGVIEAVQSAPLEECVVSRHHIGPRAAY